MDDTEKQLKFAYYQDQWTHIRHHEQQRSSLTLQLLVISVSLGGAYFAAQHVAPTFAREVQVAAALSILLLSVLGVAVVLRTTSAIKTHVSRARAARESLKFLEEFAQLENAPWPRWYIYYALFFAVTFACGLGLLVLAVHLKNSVGAL